MTTIVRAVQTSWACPSQWDAWTADGQYLYLRFRHGRGTVDTVRGSINANIAQFTTDDDLDGVIDLAEFCERAGLRLALTEAN